MACRSFSFPISNNETLGDQLQQNFLQSFDIVVDSTVLDTGSFLWSLYCASDTAQQCHGICPNADLAGVGVRIAFWISSILQAVLVAVSPEDSTQGSWTAAILTASVTIPAFIQKRQRQLSIYHATLVLNFATFSSVVSLAVAPMCTVWRQQGEDPEHSVQVQSAPYSDEPGIEITVYGEEGRALTLEAEHMTNLPKRKVHRQRLILSLALLTQVALQWAWSVALFTDPEYCQKACIPNTMVVIFGRILSVNSLNHELFIVWPIWLLFNVSITLIWGIFLVYSSSPSVHPVLSRRPSLDPNPSSSWRDKIPVDKGRIMVISANTMAFFLSLLFLVSSEVQAARNCVFDENSNWSFGQIAAILVALAPAWAIATALERRQRRKPSLPVDHDAESKSDQDSSSASMQTPSDGTSTPLKSITGNCEVVITTDINSPSSVNLTVPQPDIFRRRHTSNGSQPIL